MRECPGAPAPTLLTCAQALEAMLSALGLMPSTPGAHSLPATFPAVEKEFKILWADHGDGVSTQYAGACAEIRFAASRAFSPKPLHAQTQRRSCLKCACIPACLLTCVAAGTGAMKSGFTRTGKRTFGGVIDDGVKAVTRYYLNNFQVGGRGRGTAGQGRRCSDRRKGGCWLRTAGTKRGCGL